MRKLFIVFVSIALSVSAMAQQKIQLRSADKAECVTSDMTRLKASFSFSAIESQDYPSDRGTFSWLSLPNTVLGGNEGAPQIPVINELIAVPFGANPRIEITSYSTTDYRLEDYGIHTLVPRQPDAFKNENKPFVYDEAAYQTRGFRSEPMARVSVNGTMRGVQVGQLSIEPVSYDPVNNTIRVFNDIEVTVHFDGADARATEDMLVSTYSPYFDVLYKQLFNGRAIRDVYDEHPDLWKSPVRMLVIANRMFESCIQEWVAWKTLKGIYVDVNYTDNIGTSADAIKSFIQSKYAENAPTFLMIMGDEDQVPPSIASASLTSEVSDLYYSSVDGDQFVDMFHSRFSAETTAQMTAMLNKSLEYEQYTMPDPSYLNNVLLIAGHDTSGWGVTVGRPTIWYATNYYYNAQHGFDNVYEYTTDDYTNCYAPLNSGVGFANYTAHGAKTAWADPEFSVDDVANMTNVHKYFFAIGNCCITGDWGYSTPCFGEALTRAENKGAFAYIGSCPNTVWLNDYYFGVGPTSRADGTMPTYEETGTGIYDAIWMDDVYNTVNSILYVGNLAGNAAEALDYTMHKDPLYYWQAYHVLGDGSVMPYRVQPSANQVNHMAIFPMGTSTYEVSAVPGSYVAITKNGTILGTALVGSTGSVQVPVTPVTTSGEVTICVTAPNRIPYIQTVPAAALDGAYIAVDSYTPNVALVGENTNLNITFKNVGTAATTGTTTVTLTTTASNVNILTGTKTFGALAANATTTVNGFKFRFNSGISLGTSVAFHYSAVNGNDTWEGDITVSPTQIFTVTVAANNTDYGTVSGGGQFNYGESCTVTATPADGYMFTNWTLNNQVVSANATYTFNVTSDTDLVANFTEGVIIGDGGTNTSAYLPTYNYYKYSLTEQIYTSAEMGGAGVITSIAFFNGGTEKTRTLDFYMKSTTKSTFSSNTDWIAVSAADKVFSGSVTMVANDWTVVTFSSPFVYDGTSNVVLVADDNSGAYTNSPHMTCRVFDATGNQAIYVYSDGTNYNPSSPSSNNGTLLSQKNQLIVTKTAISSEPVNITVSVNPAQAGTASGGGEIAFGNVCTVSVTPNNGYYFVGWTENGVVVSSDLEYNFTATTDRDLVATFIQGTEIGQSTANNAYLPSYNYYNYSLTQQIYTADEIGSAGTINWIAFYNEGAEKTRSYDFYLKATTKTSFSSKSDWITAAASDKVFSGSVTLAAGAWTIINFTTPFEYDGTSNLVLVADDNTGSWSSSPHMTCSVFNANGNQAIYIYNDNTNFDPMSPPAASTNNDVLSVKNHILLGIVESDMTVNLNLGEGWNWWTPNVEITLADLEAALGANGLNIISQDGQSATYSSNGWSGNLTTIEVGQMYMIQVTTNCSISVSGSFVDPATIGITLEPGTNWIGFIGTQEMTLDEAFINYTPTNLDNIKTVNGTATYYQGRGWRGSINTMVPGQGYIYNSKASTPQTFSYPIAK